MSSVGPAPMYYFYECKQNMYRYFVSFVYICIAFNINVKNQIIKDMGGGGAGPTDDMYSSPVFNVTVSLGTRRSLLSLM
jgi:hypothetical protein